MVQVPVLFKIPPLNSMFIIIRFEAIAMTGLVDGGNPSKRNSPYTILDDLSGA